MKYLWLIILSFPAWSKPVSCPIPAQPHLSLSKSCIKNATSNFDNLKEFEPNYTLYSNGADKRRWIYLPTGTKIDTTNPDGWIFPVGTILWKEFSLNGRKIETRQFEKMKTGNGISTWRSSIYLWRKDQSDADWSSDGRTTTIGANYEYTDHSQVYSVPSSGSCTMCHRGSNDAALGFSYVNLSGTKKNGYRLKDLVKDKWLTTDLVKDDDIAGNDLDKQALGYLHMNCSSCHSPRGYASYMFHMNHVSGATDVKQENAYQRTVGVIGQNSRALIHPGDPARSFIFERLSNGSMPPDFAVKKHGIDEKAKSMLNEWIDSLPHQ